jgi:hypothetical protein
MIGANIFALTTTVAIIIGLSGASNIHVRVLLDEKVGEVGVWQQCGGNGYIGSTTCEAGSSCTKINDWYSQCTPNPPGTGEVAWWGQCGGNDYTGSTTCAAGSVCKWYNEWYSQCTPNLMQEAYQSQDEPDKSEENQNQLLTTDVPLWGRCGGIGYPGPTTCIVGSYCHKFNPWWSLCVPKPRCWQQCGGIGYTGPTYCGFGLTCTYQNDWFSQCIPYSPGTGEVAWWGQCGGKNYWGLTTCTAGSVCTFNNEWYSQCIPQCE